MHDLVRRSGNISVHVIAGDAISSEPIPKKTVRSASDAENLDPRPYLVALIAVAVALVVGKLAYPWSGIENVDLMFEISEKIKVEAGIADVDLVEAETGGLEDEDVDA